MLPGFFTHRVARGAVLQTRRRAFRFGLRQCFMAVALYDQFRIRSCPCNAPRARSGFGRRRNCHCCPPKKSAQWGPSTMRPGRAFTGATTLPTFRQANETRLIRAIKHLSNSESYFRALNRGQYKNPEGVGREGFRVRSIRAVHCVGQPITAADAGFIFGRSETVSARTKGEKQLDCTHC